AVHLDEGPVAARRAVVQRARDELLADAALAPREDGDVRPRHVGDDLLDGAHRGAVAEAPVVAGRLTRGRGIGSRPERGVAWSVDRRLHGARVPVARAVLR